MLGRPVLPADAIVTEHAAAAPDAPSTSQATSAESAATQTPTIRRRLAALLYESVLLCGVLFVAGLAFSLTLRVRNGLTHHNLMSAWIATVAGIYFVGLWHRGGQTLALKTWRLRVVGPHGTPPTIARATVRYLAGWLAFLPPLALHPLLDLPVAQTLVLAAVWFALWLASARFDANRQFPHDRIAGTRVVSLPRAPRPRR